MFKISTHNFKTNPTSYKPNSSSSPMVYAVELVYALNSNCNPDPQGRSLLDHRHCHDSLCALWPKVSACRNIKKGLDSECLWRLIVGLWRLIIGLSTLLLGLWSFVVFGFFERFSFSVWVCFFFIWWYVFHEVELLSHLACVLEVNISIRDVRRLQQRHRW